MATKMLLDAPILSAAVGERSCYRTRSYRNGYHDGTYDDRTASRARRATPRTLRSRLRLQSSRAISQGQQIGRVEAGSLRQSKSCSLDVESRTKQKVDAWASRSPNHISLELIFFVLR